MQGWGMRVKTFLTAVMSLLSVLVILLGGVRKDPLWLWIGFACCLVSGVFIQLFIDRIKKRYCIGPQVTNRSVVGEVCRQQAISLIDPNQLSFRSVSASQISTNLGSGGFLSSNLRPPRTLSSRDFSASRSRHRSFLACWFRTVVRSNESGECRIQR
jgi:hypothetical protein